MNIEIRAHEVVITEAIKNYIEKKVTEALEKFYKGEETNNIFTMIEVSKLSNSKNKGDQFKVSAKISNSHKDFFVEAINLDLYSAIDALKNKIIYNLSNLRNRRESISRRVASKFKKLFKRGN